MFEQPRSTYSLRPLGGWPRLLISLASPTQWGAPSFAFLCRVPRHDLQSVPTHPLHFLILRWAGEPVLDHGRALALQLDFADQSAAVIHLQPVAYRHHLHPLSRQGVTDGPVFSPQRHLASRIHLQHARARRIFPARWIGLIASCAPVPAGGRSLHPQRLVRAYMIVLPTKLVQPHLRIAAAHPAPRQRPLQLAMKSLHLALRLRMPYPAPVQVNPLPHQPQRQLRHPARTVHAPPWRAVIHQHSLRHPVLAKGRHQRLSHLFGVRARHHMQRDHIAAVVVDHGQRTHFLVPQLWPFEVHLPEFVRHAALEPLCSRRVLILFPHQATPQQNAMHRVPRQLDAFALQQHAQLARSPVRITFAQLHHALLHRRRRPPWTLLWPPTAFVDPRYSRFAIALQPLITHRPRDSK